MEIKKFAFFALLCIISRTPVNGKRENQLFSLEMNQPWYPGDTVDVQFDLIGKPYIKVDWLYWMRKTIGIDGQLCDVEKTRDNSFCHLSLMHNYFANESQTLHYNSDDFLSTFHSFFEMIWRPEEDQTCLKIIYSHRMRSHYEVLVNISSIDEMTDEMTFITSLPLPRTKGVQMVMLNQVHLKKYQKYILTILVRTKEHYFKVQEHRKSHNWFGLVWINQLFDCDLKHKMERHTTTKDTTTVTTTTRKYRATQSILAYDTWSG